MITIDVRHDGLGRLVRVVAPVKTLAERRAKQLSKHWDDGAKRRESALRGVGADAFLKLDAEERTKEAEDAVSSLTAILFTALQQTASADWALQYEDNAFAEAPPAEPPRPPLENEPQQSDFKAAPLTLATLLSPRALRKRKEDARAKFETAHNGWSYLKRWREHEYAKACDAFQTASAGWKTRQANFFDLQARTNARLDALVQGYARGEADAVTGHCDLALLSLDRPQGFPCFWTTSYADGVLQIDYDLPSMAAVPVLKAVKYAPVRQVFDTVALSERERERLYGEAVFQTSLAVLHTLFTADNAHAIRAISFNGWANFIDTASMRPVRACIVSLTADRGRFAEIDLASADPKACFRALNGVMSPKLAALVERSAG
ncbi:MAG: hypothetical protein P4L57_05095 [Rhizomicrobium sp.]|nr:hypothetical protein [Rhizomicrobium sp.]